MLKSSALAFTVLLAGATHSCAVGRDHSLTCWGSNADGELGDGVSAATEPPVKAASLGAHVVAAAAGAHVTCAVTDDGKADCVGRNDRAQAGQPAGTAVVVPTAIALDLVTAAAVGGTRGCARRAGARLYCWGDDAAVMPVRDGVGAIAVGAGDACSARADGVDCAAFGDPHLSCK